ncbi:hypothetical protein [Sphingosinicella sp.]|uniref:hypothetical protein n=1 Tax=Sphingosinicella sp. TaxID=1917971 RepID=UPI004037FE7B
MAQPQGYGIVQPIPAPDAGADLRRNLTNVGSNPNDIAALVDSGRAALAMGDAQAALTFFSRADEVSPRDARIKAGMATAMTLLGQPRAALTLFAEAQGLGAPEEEVAADRGLAHDLLGDPRAAQRDYALALRRRDNDETRRRLALSLAISGQREPALRLLEPQIRRNDRAGWRTQAFVLALTGDAAGAARVAAGAGPIDTAEAMAPFLGRLPALSPAQRAMAVHLGIFPSDGRAQYAANIDTTPDPGALALAGGPARPPAPPAAADERSRRDERPGLRRQPRASSPIERAAVAAPSERRQVATTEPRTERLRPYLVPGPNGELRTPIRATRPAPTQTDVAPLAQAAPTSSRFAPPPVVEEPAAPAEESPAPFFEAQAASPPAEPASPSSGIDASILAGVRPGDVIAAPGFSLTPRSPPPPAIPAPSDRRNSALGDIAMVVNDLWDQPGTLTLSPAAPGQAVSPPPAPRRAASPVTPAPSRHWVQVAGNIERSSMAGELRRLRGRAPTLLNGMQGWTTPGRLLVGPFGSSRDAQAFVNQLRPRGIEAVPWSSAAGQAVERLPAATGSASTARPAPERRTGASGTRGRTEAQRTAASSRAGRGRNEETRAASSSRSARARTEETRAGAGSRNARNRAETSRTGANARNARAEPTRTGATGRNSRTAANDRSNRNPSTIERRANGNDARTSRNQSAPEQRSSSRGRRSN